ncbi:MAG: ATP-binding cassette domain-containing protein [Planctomycetes bacterium]|nr:ATP-binding cassette domain-containing protein [Planctomycetota bacterium]
MKKFSLPIDDCKRFYAFIRPYRFRAIMALVVTGVVGMLGGVIPALLKPYIDTVVFGDGDAGVGSLFFPVLIIAFALVESSLSFAANYLTTWVGKHIGNDVKLALFDKLLHSDPALFDKTTSGDVLLRYNTDADLASEGLLGNIRQFLVRLVTSVILIAVMLYYSWILAVVAVGCLLTTVVPLSRVRKRLKQYIKETVESGAQVTTNYNEAYSGNRVITSYNLYDYARNRLDRTLKNIFHLSIKMVQRTSSLSMFMHFATAVGIALTVWLQGYLIQSGRITPGDFVACITALIMLYTPIKRLGTNLSTIQNSLMAIGRLLAILDMVPAIVSKDDAVCLKDMKEGVVYDNVSFSYDKERPVLKGISLKVGVGQSVAFVGSSGGGKTTLVNLLPRFYDVDEGAIRIDGVDVRDIELGCLRDLIAIVFQDNFLFGGSIRDNIVLGKQDANDDDVRNALQLACLDEFVYALPNGIDTQIGERGVLLSGGQKQRVAIARAFIKDSPIVILDEATSALDTKSEEVVQRAIENLMKNKTVFIIAHRLSTVINADAIVVLKDGTVVETGTHRELLNRPDSLYSSLYRTQLA